VETHLSLIKNEDQLKEKRVLPRSPYCFLTFKDNGEGNHVFEIKDISNSGMQLALKNGVHKYDKGHKISGMTHWLGKEVKTIGEVQWTRENRLGVRFDKKSINSMNEFLALENLVRGMRPLHKLNLDMELPANLKYWVRGDGPTEIFVWQHADGELAKFQVIILENFVEWGDGNGVRTGRVLSKRDVDTPLLSEDEFVFAMDNSIDDNKLDLAQALVANLPAEYMTQGAVDFLSLKLG